MTQDQMQPTDLDTIADFAAALWNSDSEAHNAALLDRLERHYYHARPVTLPTYNETQF